MNAEQGSQTSLRAAIVKMGELSKDHQIVWIEKLFARFEAMYGKLFIDSWSCADAFSVKAEWADGLKYYTGLQIAWALDQCRTTSDFPPTLPKFISLCRAAPRPEVLALPEPQVSAEVAAERAKEIDRQISAAVVRKTGHDWATKILSNIAQGVVYCRFLNSLQWKR